MNNGSPCETMDARLTAYALGELPPDQVAPLEAHLGTCPECRSALRDVQSTVGLLRDALAHTPVAARELDATHRQRALRKQGGLWPAVRDFLGLPSRGQDEQVLWPGALARAALVYVVPLIVVAGLLLPGFRMLWKLAERGAAVAAATNAPVAAETTGVAGTTGYDVTILAQPDFPERDPIAPPGPVTRPAREPDVYATSSVFDAIAEHWADEGLIRNEVSWGSKLGLGMNPERQAVDLAEATAPVLAADIARSRDATQRAGIAATPITVNPVRPGSGSRLTMTMSSYHPATNLGRAATTTSTSTNVAPVDARGTPSSR